ncbi:protein-tyrosine phosphatase-like protein [Mycena belliarum]|uniref:Protein-tyrosine phosphatase-like protein n=1 Tax=Mycena belliarum TaxID=1033014 RepID=A0AAD6TTE4_9AGAR|nr:protein-tyrosine phosphatase-like protein [Mycena belliae]
MVCLAPAPASPASTPSSSPAAPPASASASASASPPPAPATATARAHRRAATAPYPPRALRLRLSVGLGLSLSVNVNALNLPRTLVLSPCGETKPRKTRHAHSASAPCSASPLAPAQGDVERGPRSAFPACARAFSFTAPQKLAAAHKRLQQPVLDPTVSPTPSFSHITPHLAISDLAAAEDAQLLKREGVTHVVSVLGERVHIPAHIPPTHHLQVPLADTPFAELVGTLAPVVAWVRRALALGADDEGGNTEREHKHVRILIHCAHGISRSPAVGAALLVALPLAEVGGDELESDECSSSPSSASSASSSSSAFSAPPPPPLLQPSPAGTPTPAPRCTTTLSAPAALMYVTTRRPVANPNWGFRAQLREWEGVCRSGAAAGAP